MLRNKLNYLLLLLLMSGCVEKVYFTQQMREGINAHKDVDLNYIQFYNDQPIILKREKPASLAEIANGRVNFSDELRTEIVEIKKFTKGVFVGDTDDPEKSNYLRISFESQDFIAKKEEQEAESSDSADQEEESSEPTGPTARDADFAKGPILDEEGDEEEKDKEAFLTFMKYRDGGYFRFGSSEKNRFLNLKDSVMYNNKMYAVEKGFDARLVINKNQFNKIDVNRRKAPGRKPTAAIAKESKFKEAPNR